VSTYSWSDPFVSIRVETDFVDDHTKCIDVALDGGLIMNIIGDQKFWCGPIDGCPSQGERIKDDCVQAIIPEKSSQGLSFAD
jgi:hypothetical protein